MDCRTDVFHESVEMASLRKVATLVGLLVTLSVSHLFLSASRSISVEPTDWPTNADEDWKSIRADDMSAEQLLMPRGLNGPVYLNCCSLELWTK